MRWTSWVAVAVLAGWGVLRGVEEAFRFWLVRAVRR